MYKDKCNGFFVRANAAVIVGDYLSAIKLYEQGIKEYPELSCFYSFNIDLLKRKYDLKKTDGEIASQDSLCVTKESKSVSNKKSLVLTIDDLYQEVKDEVNKLSLSEKDSQPLVSILMTAHNVAGYIEASITSLLRQTWQRIEVIVIDDASDDDTWIILQRLQKTDKRLKCRRLNTNLGTYFAKNYAFLLSSGKYIFFQDADDLSHIERIRIGMSFLENQDVHCVRGVHSRISYPSGKVLFLNGKAKRSGFITLGVKRKVFDDIGYFNCTTKASDDEFVERLEAYIQKKGGKIYNLDLPLYYSTYREGSLTADMITNDPDKDGNIRRENSLSRSKYKESFLNKHLELGVDGFKGYFKYPVIRDLIPVEPDMTSLVNPSKKVVVALCSIPERKNILKKTLSSLAPQADALYIYLDRYDEIPDFVKKCHENVKVYLSCDYPGLRDNGKFLSFKELSEECYFFTADDDILYPPDYVATMIRKIEYYGRQAVVGLHGVLIPEDSERYYSGYRKVIKFNNALEQDVIVNNLGTGTVAFYSSVLKDLDVMDFHESGMADIYFSIYCKKYQVPMISIARHDEWLQDISETSPCIYNEQRLIDEYQSMLIRTNRPWGYKAIKKSVSAAVKRSDVVEVRERLLRLIPDLCLCLR